LDAEDDAYVRTEGVCLPPVVQPASANNDNPAKHDKKKAKRYIFLKNCEPLHKLQAAPIDHKVLAQWQSNAQLAANKSSLVFSE
jgi:hypothetical protein